MARVHKLSIIVRQMNNWFVGKDSQRLGIFSTSGTVEEIYIETFYTELMIRAFFANFQSVWILEQ